MQISESDGNLNVSTIVSSSVGFIYLSACHSAAPANSSSSARGHMYSVGVPMTVGFKSTVGADDDYYGELSVINRFDDHLFNYMAGQGKCLSLAINYAAADVYYQSVDHYYFGVDSIEYTGGSSYLP